MEKEVALNPLLGVLVYIVGRSTTDIFSVA